MIELFPQVLIETLSELTSTQNVDRTYHELGLGNTELPPASSAGESMGGDAQDAVSPYIVANIAVTPAPRPAESSLTPEEKKQMLEELLAEVGGCISLTLNLTLSSPIEWLKYAEL